MKRLLKMAALLALAVSCDLQHDTPSCGNGERETIRFDIMTPHTRSSLPVQDSRIRDLNLYAYADGYLDSSVYCEDVDGLSLALRADTDYNLYAIANAGEVEAPLDEDDLEVLTLMIDGLSSLEEVFPMAWNESVNTGNTRLIHIGLERLVARVGFRIESSELAGLEVSSIRLRQSALDVRPFSGRSSAVYVCDGDYASPDDITAVNNGGTVWFYALENCKGSLLRGNTDPWQKVPDRLGYNADYCTYLEVECSASSVKDMSGSVLYRMYLGTDNCSNFDLLRNNEIVVTLKTTMDGLAVESWKIDAGNLSMSEYLEIVPSSILMKYGKRDTLVLSTNLKDISIHTTDFEPLGLSYERSGNFIFIDCRCWYAGGGMAYITASSGTRSDVCRVEVNNVPEGISVPGDIVMARGTTKEVVIMPVPLEVDFHYPCECESSDNTVATIREVYHDTFEISARSPGTCTVTARFGDLTGSFNVTVTQVRVPMTSLEVPDYVDVPFGETEYCSFSIVPSDATDNLTVTSEDESIATIWETGRGVYAIKGRKAGKTRADAVSSGGIERSFDIYVTTAAELRMSGDEVTLYVEDSGQGAQPANLDAVANIAAETNYIDIQDIHRIAYDTLRVWHSCRFPQLNPGVV